jgi:hypothetical protein
LTLRLPSIIDCSRDLKKTGYLLRRVLTCSSVAGLLIAALLLAPPAGATRRSGRATVIRIEARGLPFGYPPNKTCGDKQPTTYHACGRNGVRLKFWRITDQRNGLPGLAEGFLGGHFIFSAPLPSATFACHIAAPKLGLDASFPPAFVQSPAVACLVNGQPKLLKRLQASTPYPAGTIFTVSLSQNGKRVGYFSVQVINAP